MILDALWALLIVASFLVSVFYFVRLCVTLERGFVLRSLGLLAVYCAYCGAGIALVWWLASPPAPEEKALAAALFAVLWIGYGGVWLARLAPRGDGHPAPSARRRRVDIAFLVAGTLSAAYLVAV